MKDIVIYDTNIFIDLIDMDILESLSKADIAIHTNSLVLDEITKSGQRSLIENKLELNVYTYDTIEQYISLYNFKDSIEQKKNLSDPDFSILKLAIDLSAPLYTSDANLRSVAIVQGVNVRGSLGIVIELNKAGILNKKESLTAIEKLRAVNKRIANSVFETAIKEIA